MKQIIISLGGSLIYPENIDTDFVSNFKLLIESYVKKDFRFVIICGGGRLARHLQTEAVKIAKLSDEDKDWLGIEATKLNAYFIKLLFPKDEVYDTIISNPTEKISTTKKIIICSGWKPGWSTDYDAVLLAKNLGIAKMINMSNISHVYDSDPKRNPNAKPLKNIPWKDFRNLVGEKWSPGLNMPFDPIAASEAASLNLKVIIIGKDLDNLKKVLDESHFIGTVIG